MPRRKSFFKFSFFKIKVNKRTVFNIIGFIVLGFGLLSFLSLFSFTGQGRFVVFLRTILSEYFGFLALFPPIIIIFSGFFFFNSRRLKFVKANFLIGLIFIFIGLLGLLRVAQAGNLLRSNLEVDFSPFGAWLILFICFLVGILLFFDTSIDNFLIFLVKIIKTIFYAWKKYFFGLTNKLKTNSNKSVREDKKEEFVAQIEKKPIFEDEKISKTNSQVIKPILFKDQFEANQENFTGSKTAWVYPPLTLFNDISFQEADRGDTKRNAQIIEDTLDSFGIRASVVDVKEGPTVTQYAINITRGTKLSKITALANDLALALAASTGQVRIEAPIPGKSLVGIEIPNLRPEIVPLKKILADPLVSENKDPLLVPLGLNVSGEIQVASIGSMPHVLIAGATGSGKSVLLNAWITSLLFRTRPDEVRLILVDPKRVELTLYNGIPHLLDEVIVESEKIISALKWTVDEMNQRYKDFSKYSVRNLEGYNEIPGVEKKPYIIFIIDELADLMMFAPGQAEELITRIAQMSRATGIHLVLATQRPSVDVITGLMKANIPTRIAFNVSSMVDSRVIIDMPGAEKLLGRGDMLYLPPDRAKPIRIQGPYLTEKDVGNVVKFIRAQNPRVEYTQELTKQPVTIVSKEGNVPLNGGDRDPLFDKAVEIIMHDDKASASLLQRRLSIGYARAARILDQLEAAGYVGPAEGSKPRDVIKRPNITSSKED